MGIILDILLIGLVIFGAFRGAKKGFVRVLIEVLATLIVIPICILLSGPAATVLAETTEIDEKVYSYISKMATEKANEETDKNIERQTTKNAIFGKIAELTKDAKNKTAEEISSVASKEITGMVMRAIAFVVMYILLSFLVVVLRTVLGGIIDHIPLINKVNNLAGAGMGIVKELLLILIALLLLQVISIGMPKNKAEEVVLNSIITKQIYAQNPLKGIVLPK